MIEFRSTEKPPILEAVESHGFLTFDGAWDLNLIGLRTPTTEANMFDDYFFVVCRDSENNWCQWILTCTTDPGSYWLRNPSRVSGTAIMVDPQQARSAYQLDLHAGRYLALCQRKPIKVWRDANKNEILDRYGEEHVGYFGINIHRASQTRVIDQVERYSAGCTVIQKFEEFDFLLELCRKQIAMLGYDKFTYTLISGELSDFVE